MNPRPFSFQLSRGSKSRLRGHLNGFIVKIWLWTEHYKKLRPTQRINKRSVFTYALKNFTCYSTDLVENVMLITFNDSGKLCLGKSFLGNLLSSAFFKAHFILQQKSGKSAEKNSASILNQIEICFIASRELYKFDTKKRKY